MCVVVVCIAVIIDVINVLTRVACGNTKKCPPLSVLKTRSLR